MSNDISAEDPFSRFERFQSLEPGMYWRAKVDVPIDSRSSIGAGLVLLLGQIDYYDNKIHTVILNGHPLLHPGCEFKFLVDDFLSKFEFAPDADAVRQRELLELQAEVYRLQGELMEGQSNSALIAPFVESEVSKWEKSSGNEATPGLPAVVADGSTMSTSVSLAIDRRVSPEDTKAMRVYAERQAVIAKAHADWIQARTSAISTTFSKMTPFYKEKAAVALAKTQNVRDFAKQVMKGLESMDLYIGNGVSVETIAAGASAPAGEPLTLFQRKLFVDEEFAAWADVDAEFDFYSMPAFDKALAENPSLLNQLIPAPRGVVSMAIRRSNASYEGYHPLEAVRRNIENKCVFLLVRDGENIHRVYSAQPTHEATPRLFPTTNELNNIFRGIDGSEITFRDLDFTDKAKTADNVALHYKRFLILLCGLDHRLNLFGRFYDPAEFGSFISLAFQERNFRFVADDEPGSLLGNGRLPVNAWISAMNRFLQSGSRVMCYHEDLISPESAPSCEKWRYNSGRDYLQVLAKPLVDSEVLVAYRDGKEICVDVRVARETWRDVVNPEFNARVSLTQAKSRSFLCLDAVKPEEVEFYIHNREARVDHVHFIRLFKRVAQLLREDAAAEAESRAYIRQCVTEAGFAGNADIDDLIDESVRTWRAANRGKLLPSVVDKLELNPLLDHLYARCRAGDLLARTETFIAESGISALKVVMTGKNKLVVYAEVPAAERDERIVKFGWVRRITLSVLKTKLSIASESMVWLTRGEVAGEVELKVYDEFANWINVTPEVVKHAALQRHIEIVASGLQSLFPEGNSTLPDEVFMPALEEMRSIIAKSRKMVKDVHVGIPLATYVDARRKDEPKLFTIVAVEHAATWLYALGDDTQREILRKYFLAQYKNKNHASDILSGELEYQFWLIEGAIDRAFAVQEHFHGFSMPEGLSESMTWRVMDTTSSIAGISFTKKSGPRSLNHAMQTWLCSSDFEKFTRRSPILFNPAAWDGKRSHLERYLVAGAVARLRVAK